LDLSGNKLGEKAGVALGPGVSKYQQFLLSHRLYEETSLEIGNRNTQCLGNYLKDGLLK